jgi:hypothetical protein
MKQFNSTKLFLTLREASQNGIDIDAQVLESEYDEFVISVFSENAAFTDQTAYRNALVYTRVELSSLTGVSGKKCYGLFCKIHPTD